MSSSGFPITSALGPGGTSCVYFRDNKNRIQFYSAQQTLEIDSNDPDPNKQRLNYDQNLSVTIDGQVVLSSTKDLAALSYLEKEGKGLKIRLYYVNDTNGDGRHILKEACLDLADPKEEVRKQGVSWYNGVLNDLKVDASPDNYLTAHINTVSNPWQLKVYAFKPGSKTQPTVAWVDYGSSNWKTLPGSDTIASNAMQ